MNKLKALKSSLSKPTRKIGIYLTPQGLQKIKDELKFLQTTKRLEVTERISSAREIGGLEENSEFDAAIEEQSLVEGRIMELESMIRQAQIINPTHNDKIMIGSTVMLDIAGAHERYTIVGKVEANPSLRKISDESPIGIALLGAQIGQDVEVNAGEMKYRCKVLDIE